MHNFQIATLTGDLCLAIGKYELVKHNRIIQTEIEELKVRLYDNASSFIQMLKEVGFKDIKAIKTFDRQKTPDSTDETIVYECRK